MLSYTLGEYERFSKPVCSDELFATKIDNFRKVEDAFIKRKKGFDALPIQIHLEPTGRCNLYCPICPRGKGLIKRGTDLPFAVFENFFNQLHETLGNIVVSGFGEPLLNDETPKMIKLASKNAVAVFLNTNGTVLKEKAVAVVDSQPVVINISLDGAVSKSTHLYNSKYTFDDVARGVESLSNQKVKMGFNYPQIHGQFILTDETVDEIESLKKWAKNIGVEYTKFKRQHSTMPGELEREKFFSKPDFEQLTKHKKLKSSENLDFSPKECSHPWDSIFLSCEGNIGICSFDPQQILTLGHNTEDFSTLWNSDLAKQVRKWHSGNCNEIGEPCSKCNRLPGYLLPAEKIEIRT